MVSQRSIGLRTIALLWLLVAVTLSFWGWLFVVETFFFEADVSLPRYLLYNEFLLVGILFASGAKSAAHEAMHPFVQASRQSARQAVLGMFCVFMVAFATRDVTPSRAFFFSYLPWLCLALLFCNYLLPRTLGRWAFSGLRQERVALVGTPEQAGQFRPWLDRKQLLGLRTVGLVTPQPAASDHSPLPIIGPLDAIEEILRRGGITQLIVLDLSLGSQRLRQLTQVCEGAAVRLLALNNLNAYFGHNTTIFEDDGVRFIGLREEPLESPLGRFFKRGLDLAVALPVIVLLLPFTTLLVWIAQRVQSPGPVFFRQERSGMMGHPFLMIKYRTMHPNNRNPARQASKDDPRIFPAGYWLRKLSIDELPQFINVLLGHMSVVGPRPHLVQHDEQFTQVMRTYVIRRFIRPGITGWAQVNGFRGEIHSQDDIQKRVEADLHYLENWSFSLDCLIILKTVRHCVFPPRSAY